MEWYYWVAIIVGILLPLIGAAIGGLSDADYGGIVGIGVGLIIDVVIAAWVGWLALIYFDILAMVDAYTRQTWGWAAVWTIMLLFLLGGFGRGTATAVSKASSK